MESDSHRNDREATEQARQLSEALGAIEARLDSLGSGAAPDAIAGALAEPVKALGAAAKGAIR